MKQPARHRRRFGALFWLLTGLGLWLGAAAPSMAHPHAWIDMIIVLQTNANGKVDAIDQTWVIDPTYSRYLYDDAMEQFEGTTPDEKLANLGAEILENLAEYHWYTEVHADDQSITVQPEGESRLFQENRQIHFQFRLLLDVAVDPRTSRLRYAIYDPTYFIEVLHDPATPPRFESDAGNCRLEIRRPRPDPVIVAKALALDFNQTGDADLGHHFAETVTAYCD